MKKDRKKRIRNRILTAFLLLVIAVGIFLTLYLVRVRSITVEGDEHYPSEAVIRRVFPMDEPRLMEVVREKYFMSSAKRSVFKSVRIRIPSLQSCVIALEEKEPFVVLMMPEERLFVTENGILLYTRPLGSSSNSDVIVIDGLPIKDYTVFSVPETGAKDEVMKAVRIASGIRERDIDCKAFRYENGAYFLDFGDVTVAFGPADSIDAKLDAVKAQYPHYAGLKGTLHMEKYTRESEGANFYFTVEP